MSLTEKSGGQEEYYISSFDILIFSDDLYPSDEKIPHPINHRCVEYHYTK